jgi:hypothetical protein
VNLARGQISEVLSECKSPAFFVQEPIKKCRHPGVNMAFLDVLILRLRLCDDCPDRILVSPRSKRSCDRGARFDQSTAGNVVSTEPEKKSH